VILGLSMATVNVGCVADRLTSEHRVALKEAPSVEFIHRRPEPFQVVTESNLYQNQPGLLVFLGVPGPHTPEGDGQIIRSETHIEDPSEQVKRDMAQYVSEVASPRKARIIDAVQPDGELPSELRNSGSQVFSFRTLLWRLMYYRFDTSFHYLMFSGEGKLIDSTTGDTVWRSTCDYIEDAPRMSRPSLEDYTADGGKRLKAELARAAHACTAQLKRHLVF
jgi:hypothetical protein